MSTKQPLNRRFYEGPDVETLNILIELGEIVKHSEPVVWDIVPADLTGVRESLLRSAADAILGIKALRNRARIAEAADIGINASDAADFTETVDKFSGEVPKAYQVRVAEHLGLLSPAEASELASKPDPRDQEVPDVIEYEATQRPKPYDFRLPVFPRGDAA